MKYGFFVAVSALLVACSPTVEVSRVVSQEQAEHFSGTKLAPSAIVHADGSRTPLTSDTKIAHGRALIPKSNELFVVSLGPNDVVEVDAGDRITGVRLADGSVVTFVPGTAVSPDGTNEVRGKLAGASDGDRTIDLASNDRIEISGELAEGDRIPGVGHVETSRFTPALIFGGIVTALAYAPAAYVGAASTRNGDRILLLPVFGPWIDIAGRDKCETPSSVVNNPGVPTDPCVAETANRVGIITSGVAQALGGALLIAGIPEHAEFVEPSHDGAKRKSPAFSWSIAPFQFPHATGLAAVGTF